MDGRTTPLFRFKTFTALAYLLIKETFGNATLSIARFNFQNFVGSATYQLSKFLKNILSPLVGNTVYTVKNSAEFVELIEKINIHDNEYKCLLM